MKMMDIFSSISGMSTRPGYYAGYGASRNNLGEKELEQIFDLIKEHHGDQAAEAMLDMVEGLKSQDMAAISVMQALYNLEGNGYKYIKSESSLTGQAVVEEATVSPGVYEATPSAMLAMKVIMRGTGDDDDGMDFLGDEIRRNFLASHSRLKRSEDKRFRRCDLNGNFFGSGWDDDYHDLGREDW